MRRTVDETILRGVITYKWVKGVVQLALAVALLVTLAMGLDDELQQWAHEFRNHSTRAYAVLLGRVLERATTPKGLHITLVALWVDGTVTCIEAWALQRRHAWGVWLVVAVTGSLLPFEVYELGRHFTPGRFLVLLVNAAVVVFLAMHARAQALGLLTPEPGGTRAPPDPAQPPAPGGRPRSGAAAPPDPAQPRGSSTGS